MVIAAGSYPAGRWFESDRRYHIFGMNTQRLMPKIRPLGQAVKTSPFHGGNTSSSLVGVTKKQSINNSWCFIFLSKSQTSYIIECITRLWQDIHSYIITL